MATKVYLFLEEEEFELAVWEDVKPEFRSCVDNHRISVCPGRNSNHAWAPN